MGADISDLHGTGAYERAAVSSRNLEKAHENSLEKLLTLQKAVHDLEAKLEIEKRWVPGSEPWTATQKMEND
jgi:hypothetical protein